MTKKEKLIKRASDLFEVLTKAHAKMYRSKKHDLPRNQAAFEKAQRNYGEVLYKIKAAELEEQYGAQNTEHIVSIFGRRRVDRKKRNPSRPRRAVRKNPKGR